MGAMHIVRAWFIYHARYKMRKATDWLRVELPIFVLYKNLVSLYLFPLFVYKYFY